MSQEKSAIEVAGPIRRRCPNPIPVYNLGRHLVFDWIKVRSGFVILRDLYMLPIGVGRGNRSPEVAFT